MKRVTIVNLAGRALHVEDEGVEAIDGWMDSARGTLAADPDRDELLSDFEEAIADRFAAYAPGATDVVTASQVDEVLTALGSVEPADVVLGESDESARADEVEPVVVAGESAGAGGDEGAGREEVPFRQRRLYRLTGEGEGMIAGVAAGIGSYLNIDVTVVRLVAIILAIVSLGATVLVYVGLALIVPAADSPDERLAARGYGDSAREVMSRARTSTRPALASVGSALRAGAVVILAVVTWSLVLAISAVLIGGSVAVTWVFVDPEPLATAFDDGVSTWVIAVWVSSGFWLAAGVLIVLAALVRRLAAPKRNGVLGLAVGGVGLVMMTAAAIGLVTIPLAGSTQMRGLLDGEGEIEIFEETWCFTSEYGFEEKRGECDEVSSRRVIGEVRGVGALELELVGHRMLVVGERVEALGRRLELRLGDGLEFRLRR